MKDGPTRRRMDEADQGAPLVAVLYGCNRAVSLGRPDPTQDRLQANTIQYDVRQWPTARPVPRGRPSPPPEPAVSVFFGRFLCGGVGMDMPLTGNLR